MAGLISAVSFSKILNKNLTLNFKNKMKQDHFVQQKLAMHWKYISILYLRNVKGFPVFTQNSYYLAQKGDQREFSTHKNPITSILKGLMEMYHGYLNPFKIYPGVS